MCGLPAGALVADFAEQADVGEGLRRAGRFRPATTDAHSIRGKRTASLHLRAGGPQHQTQLVPQ